LRRRRHLRHRQQGQLLLRRLYGCALAQQWQLLAQ